MSIDLVNIKESNEFLNLLFESLNSVILIADKQLKIKKANNTFEVLFKKRNESVIGKLCGDALGCHYPIEENKICGETSYCNYCDLRASIKETYKKKNNLSHKLLTRDFYINTNKVKKHLQYSTRHIVFDEEEFVVIILNDITELKEQEILLKEKNQEITASIRYAKKIQTSLLPQEGIFASTFDESFIIFKPKDIVSGDFYWIYKNNNVIYVAVADCTGHGVPGAFMSLLGISFLNQIITEFGLITPSEILDNLRKLIIQIFAQHSNEMKDGMDITIIAINLVTLECQYSNANNSLFLIRKHSKQIEELLPNKMPVAIYDKMIPFTNNTIELEKGDILYLRTDGFEDQFGGPKNKKYYSKHLKELLLQNCEKPFHEQKKLITASFENWKGKQAQIDDVTLMGIKI